MREERRCFKPPLRGTEIGCVPRNISQLSKPGFYWRTNVKMRFFNLSYLPPSLCYQWIIPKPLNSSPPQFIHSSISPSSVSLPTRHFNLNHALKRILADNETLRKKLIFFRVEESRNSLFFVVPINFSHLQKDGRYLHPPEIEPS